MKNVPQSIYTGLMEAHSVGNSVGAYMHKYVIDVYPYRRMNQKGGTLPKKRRHKQAPRTAGKGKVIPFRQKRDIPRQ